MKRLGPVLAAPLLLAATAVAVTGTSSPALAATCNPHCYGIATMTRTTHGATANLRVTCLSVSNWQTQFVDEEFWVLTSGSTWVEEGMTVGTPRSARSWYWADSRPNGGYHEHYPSHSASLNTTYIMTISYAGNNSWNVYEHGGSPLGVSTANNSSSPKTEAGEEITDTTAKGAAVLSSLYYKDTGDTFHAGWPASSISGHNPPTAQWISTNNSLRAYSNCAAPSVAGPDTSATSVDAIVSAARDLGTRYGSGKLPTSLTYARASRSAVARALPGAVAASAPPAAVVVTMTGTFAGGGTVLTAVYDAATGRLSGTSISGRPADLSELGEQTVVYKQSKQVSASVLGSVLDSAKRLAGQNGEPMPAAVSYVQSTRADASAVMSGSRTVDSNPSVVVVTMSGRFVGHAAKVPPGQALPTGNYLTAAYDAQTGELTDWSITASAPAVSALGATHVVS